jgi:long-chain acyl-CoA synthetase
MGRVIAWLSRRVETTLSELDVTLPQYRVLMLLEGKPEGASVVADELAVTRPTVTAIIDGLVGRGLVDRASDPSDRRRVRLLMTAEGRDVLAKADAVVEDRLTTMLDGLGSAAGRKAAVRGLQYWRAALTS